MQFPSKVDRKPVSAKLMLPPGRMDGKRPAIVYVHGAGIATSVLQQWGSYNELRYVYNTYLANRGYVVLDLDYRGSTGYGRDWRSDVYLHMGGKDLEDVLGAVDYLKTLGKIDTDRLGIWGVSYGGFMTNMALFLSPGTFKAGSAWAAVNDWENYNAGYTLPAAQHPGIESGSLSPQFADPFLEQSEGSPADHSWHGGQQRLVPGCRPAYREADPGRQGFRAHVLPAGKPRLHSRPDLDRRAAPHDRVVRSISEMISSAVLSDPRYRRSAALRLECRSTAAEALLTAGARILQLRHKGHFDRPTYADSHSASRRCASDAQAALRDQRSRGYRDAARCGGPCRTGRPPAIGCAQTDRAAIGLWAFQRTTKLNSGPPRTEPIDYVALGPIFGTISKQNPDPEVGRRRTEKIESHWPEFPVVAIGGITRATAAEVWAAGADSIAVVGDLYPDVRRSAEEWLKLS